VEILVVACLKAKGKRGVFSNPRKLPYVVSSQSSGKRRRVVDVHSCGVIFVPVCVLMQLCWIQTHFPPVQPCLGITGMRVWTRTEHRFSASTAATLGVRDAREVWAPPLLIPIEILAASPHAFGNLCLVLFLISDLGKLGLSAAGLVLRE